jgi:multisubunit Na+/H+ antiporter MnhB subunit
VPCGFLVLLGTGGEYAPDGARAHDITAVVALAVTVVATVVAVGFGLRASRRGRSSGLGAAAVGGVLGSCLIVLLAVIVVDKFTGPQYYGSEVVGSPAGDLLTASESSAPRPLEGAIVNVYCRALRPRIDVGGGCDAS